MISESYLYKEELLRFADDLKRRQNQKRWLPRSSLLVEKELFFGFFLIRKLLETPKISDSLRNSSYPISVYKIDAPVDINWTNDHKAIDYIEFDAPQNGTLYIKRICDQFVHSFLFYLVHDDESGGLHSVMLSSDYVKSKKCFGIDIETIINVFTAFGNNYPDRISWKRKPGTCEIVSYEVE